MINTLPNFAPPAESLIMTDLSIKKIVIIGGGTAGWMSAAALSSIVGKTTEVHLVESEAIGTVGVGEATIPQIQLFNKLLGFDENEFIKTTQATFKLGIEFVNWGKLGDRYIHPFGKFGVDMDGIRFHHHWLRSRALGNTTPVGDYCLQAKAAYANKFQRPENIPGSPISSIHYAFQFDAGLYAKFMRGHAENNGCKRTEGRIVKAKQDAQSGHVTSVVLEDGHEIDGDFFIDCSGFLGLLISKTLNNGYVDWSKWLPCDRAVAVPCEKVNDALPYTRATAKEAGWQWRIPLQHRTGNGYVYCSKFIDDDAAQKSLMDDIDAAPIADPKLIKFTTGHRTKFWDKNVLSLGLAAGFMEPLESTSIHMIQTGLSRLMTVFPDKTFNDADLNHYNAETLLEYESVRDFLVLHYTATQRDDTPFWRQCRDMDIPETLQRKLDYYAQNARIHRANEELFTETSWFAVMNGQNIMPERYHPIADQLPEDILLSRMDDLQSVIAKSSDYMPGHEAYIAQHCKAKTETFS